mmetsp:Transcript_1460/g.4020  ORF Transcript_1460/g.4020 Transcript_1460/m.4020 type:complete len:386 (-) Transcript_1460:93-1250(-)
MWRWRQSTLLAVFRLLSGHGATGFHLQDHGPAVAASCDRVGQPNPGKLFFLMTALDMIGHEEVWVRFFSGGEHGVSFEAFLHCQVYHGCLTNVQRLDLFTVVPTAPSEYCENLVSPMVALLDAALRRSEPGNPHDKFIFVSQYTLPVKPFWLAHQLLTANLDGMAVFQTLLTPACGLFKASQWSVLSYWHAQRLVEAAAVTPRLGRHLLDLPKNCKDICLDESWPMVTIFGASELRKYPAEVPQTLRVQKLTWTEWRPFPPWRKPKRKRRLARADLPDGEPTRRSPVQADLPAGAPETSQTHGAWQTEEPRLSPAKNCSEDPLLTKEGGPFGPVRYSSIDAGFLAFLRSSPTLLFVRKVTVGATFNGSLSLADAWDEYVFSAAVD